MLAGATGSWSWDSILTCFKTTCFIRPSALNEPSWKNVAAFITESLLSLSVSSHHSRLTQSLSSTLFFSYTFFFLSRAVVLIIWTTHSFYLLFKKTSSTKQSSVPDTIVSSSSGFPGLGPASVHCSQLPQYILLFFLNVALLIPEAGICPFPFSFSLQHHIHWDSTVQSVNMVYKTCHMLQLTQRNAVKRADYVTQTLSKRGLVLT